MRPGGAGVGQAIVVDAEPPKSDGCFFWDCYDCCNGNSGNQKPCPSQFCAQCERRCYGGLSHFRETVCCFRKLNWSSMRFFMPLVAALPIALAVHFLFPWQSAATLLNSPYVEEIFAEAISDATPCSDGIFRVHVRFEGSQNRLDIECIEQFRSKISGGRKLALLLERRDSAFEDPQCRIRSASIDGEPVVFPVQSSAAGREPLRKTKTLAFINFFSLALVSYRAFFVAFALVPHRTPEVHSPK